jgi:Alternative oxidase.
MGSSSVSFTCAHLVSDFVNTNSSYTESQMKSIQIAHREASNWSDWVALGTVRVFRWGMDLFTGYRHVEPGENTPERFKMTEKKWMARFIFLESVAGVPGMVGGMLRHLHSLRRMKRDNGWYVPAD